MPREVVLLAGLLLPALIGTTAVMGLLRSNESDATRELLVVAGGDQERGKETIRQNGCPGCHTIPGIAEGKGLVGPSLEHLADRVYIAGVLPNTPDNLVAWIRNPPGIDPLTAMPANGLGEAEARDAAAYLYTLD
jgi:cytochrome c1